MATRNLKTRGKGEGGVTQRQDGTWCATVELPPGPGGKRRRKYLYAKTKALVLRKMVATRRELGTNGDIATSSTSTEKWMTYWLEKLIAPELRPKTYAAHRAVVNWHIIPNLGRIKLDKLTADRIRDMYDAILATPKKAALRNGTPPPPGTVMLSAAYVGTVHDTLRQALSAAVVEGKLAKSPMDAVKRPKTASKDRKALELDEAIRLLGYIADHPQGALWATFLLTGARRGEVLALEADRVTDVLDLSWQLQRISTMDKAPKDYEYRHVVDHLYLTRPKSKRGWRIIPLVPPLKDILERHAELNPGGLIFTKNGKAWNPDEITAAWKKLLRDAGLPDDIVLHGSRHTVVDLLYEAGVPEDVIQEIVGHSSRAMTRGYKSRGNRRQLEDAMNRMSRMLEPTVE